MKKNNIVDSCMAARQENSARNVLCSQKLAMSKENVFVV